MPTINPNWPISWTTAINAASVTNGSSSTSSAISNDNKTATEISITVVYGATASQGLNVYILRDVDGTNFEAVADRPWGFVMEKAVSTTFRKTFTVSAYEASQFKVHVVNNTGASVTVTVRYQQATTDSV